MKSNLINRLIPEFLEDCDLVLSNIIIALLGLKIIEPVKDQIDSWSDCECAD